MLLILRAKSGWTLSQFRFRILFLDTVPVSHNSEAMTQLSEIDKHEKLQIVILKIAKHEK